MQTIYLEKALVNAEPASQANAASQLRAQTILERYPKATVITCNRYSEVFNPQAQDFRAQKQNPALLLALKHDHFILPTPACYGVGGPHNYYFAHMLNCVYDCRYCFLQGMYPSANYVLFVNYEAYLAAIDKTLAQHADEPVWFFSGYDCDSLAFEPVSRFAEFFVPAFAKRPQALLELRTKSTQIRQLLMLPATPNIVVAFSLTPEPLVAKLEHKTASLAKRLQAIQQLIEAGWLIGLRFDPIIDCSEFERVYAEFFADVFEAIKQALLVSQRDFTEAIHSISLGTFRLPKPFYKRIVKLYPREPLLHQALTVQAGEVSYPEATNNQRLAFCRQQIEHYSPASKLYTCQL